MRGTVLGLDIGSNSVGSAWVDLDRQEVQLAVSVFPAGVDEQDDKRGAPKNQARRQTRSQRRTIHRRAARKRRLTRFLMERGLLPTDAAALRTIYQTNPWELRRAALNQALTPYEFGRVLLHLAQRRGAVGVTTDPDDPEEGKVKDGMDRMAKLMSERGARTVGELMANLIDERRRTNGKVSWHEPIRNRQYRMPMEHQLYAGRELIRDEFRRIVEAQRAFPGSELADRLTDDLLRQLDRPSHEKTWRHEGLLFGQRRTYWDTGTLGRCVLEPTERVVPEADRHAQQFRVIEYVNNLRIQPLHGDKRSLTAEERAKVIAKLRGPLERKSKGKIVPKKQASLEDVRDALGWPKRRAKGCNENELIQETADPDRPPNTDWFYREIVHGAITEVRWLALTDSQRESVNKAILHFDPDEPDDAVKLRSGAMRWWGLSEADADRLIAAWKLRPKLERRLKLSRTAIRNLLPYMNQFDEEGQHWPTQIEARKHFAEDVSNGATTDQRTRYALGAPGLTKRERQFLRKHPDLLPPAPMLTNPVVRKAIHEVRRVLIAWRRRMGRWPDRIVLEYTRSATQTERRRNELLALNRKRDKIRTELRDQFGLGGLPLNQQERAIRRILLCRQQRGLCPYCTSSELISERAAAEGTELETDHIVPRSRSNDNGLNNLVLVHRACNRDKGNRTVREWLSPAGFAALEQRMQHLGKDEYDDPYFTKRDAHRKWENLHRDAPTTDAFVASQFSDTAYATRWVGQWIREAIYGGERDGTRRVLTTKGTYTAALRRDWGLLEDVLDQHWNLHRGGGDGEPMDPRARREKGKDRGVHVHHAIDAIAIALAPFKLQELAARAAAEERARAKEGQWPRPLPLPPPWPRLPANPTREELQQAIDAFRAAAVAAAERVIVSHRPVKRRLIGAFHEDTHYGPVVTPLPPHRTERPETLFTNRISVDRLKPNHLRVPDGWDEPSARLDDPTVPPSAKAAIRRLLASMADPKPEKSGIVRDRALRDRLRKCLRACGIDPDGFSDKELKAAIVDHKLTMASGVPIKGVVLLRTNTDPVIIPRKRWDAVGNRLVLESDPRTHRVHIGGNNHHIEIREDDKSGRWVGELVPTFEAARRVRLDRRPAVNRGDAEAGRFVMSLAEGEIIEARRNDRPADAPGAVGYFVVAKLDKPQTIEFAPIWDARRASEQDRWKVSAAQLKKCGVRDGEPPIKVRIGPLGDVTRLQRD